MDQIGDTYANSALLTGHMVPHESTTTASRTMPRVLRFRAATVSIMMSLCDSRPLLRQPASAVQQCADARLAAYLPRPRGLGAVQQSMPGLRCAPKDSQNAAERYEC